MSDQTTQEGTLSNGVPLFVLTLQSMPVTEASHAQGTVYGTGTTGSSENDED
jgi:hypothetical protein